MKKIILTIALGLFVIPITNAQDLPSYVPTDGLVAYYPFNGNANDASGNENHGTVNGATLTTDKDGNGNKAYLFTVNSSSGWGASQNSITIETPTIPNNNSFTMSAWVNLAEKPSPFDNRPHTIMGRWDGNGTAIFRHQIDYNGNISTNLLEGSTSNTTQGGTLSYGNWEHVLISYDGSFLHQYQNGVLVNEEALNIQLNTSNTNLTIGELHMSNGHWYLFSGKIDEIGYWSRALTQQEIQSVFNSTNNSSGGDILFNGTVSAENNQIKNVADPTDAQDAVTKNYTYSKTEVDALIANLQQQINEMNQTITSSELEGNWNVKELYYLNPDTNEITSTFPTPECSKPYQYYEFLVSKEIFWTGIGTNWVNQSCTSNEFGVKQAPYTITTENISGDDPITYINFPGGSGTRNWEVISRPSENTIIIRAWQNNEITLYNNEVYGLKLVKEARIE